MRSLRLDQFDPPVSRVLCLGAHADDLEIGCGGTLLKLTEQHPGLDVTWVVFSSTEARAEEARRSARTVLAKAGSTTVIVQAFRDGFFPYQGFEIKQCFEKLKQASAPDLVLTHHRSDLHQDHRLISELTWNTFRDHVILEYEVPKYDGDFGSPNVFVYLDDDLCHRKIQTILDSFPTQQGKHWFSEDVFRALLRLRGMESRAPSGYAEAFYCRKLPFS